MGLRQIDQKKQQMSERHKYNPIKVGKVEEEDASISCSLKLLTRDMQHIFELLALTTIMSLLEG